MDQEPELIEGADAARMIQGWIGSRQFVKMYVPGKDRSWLTLLLGIARVGPSSRLLIDWSAGIEELLQGSSRQDVVFQLREKDGVTCSFKTRVIECRPKEILVEMPSAIYRLQKRKFFRVKARSGTVVVFVKDGALQQEASVVDYSLGGLAFRAHLSLQLVVGDRLSRMELAVPQGVQRIRFEIPLAVVRRIEKNPPEADLCGVEFLEIEEPTQRTLSRHLFEEQRLLLQRTRKA
jgi:c-di-GMP-binding flagellar brake protein YcgR